MKKRWKIIPEDKDLQAVLERELDVLPLTAQLLINRGLRSPGPALSFFRPDIAELHDPFLMADMDRATERIARAVRDHERIAVYGDYDVDGTTATALLSLFFREIGVDALCHIPDRKTEGYGLNAEALKGLAAQGAKVAITVDCGISNHEEALAASSLGIDLIITDHHEVPPEGPPTACAVLNPKREDCAFPFKGLAGVGVAFNLLMALRAVLRAEPWYTGRSPNLKRYLDLVSIGTVADVVPLVDENRVFVRYGLKELERTARPGLQALKEVSGLEPGPVGAGQVAFRLAPRINAAGRLSRASAALKLLTSDSPSEARALACVLDAENRSRQKIEEKILTEALAMAGEFEDNRGIVLSSGHWHPGVIGIVASRLVDRFCKPTVMLAVDGDVAKGSARGVKAFDMLGGLRACSGLLERFGGHRAAAGLTLSSARLRAFREEFIRHVDSTLTDDDLTPEIELDAVVTLDAVTGRLVSEIEALAPFGCANREPVLCIEDAHITDARVVGANHLKFNVNQNGSTRGGIAFGLAGLHPIGGGGYALAFSPYMDEWKGTRSLRLRVRDVRPRAG
ncbi:MAG: single-stranded-DNA-specific exonuclease RecJ [Thermodesulfobacteriota bacterium]